MAEDMVERVARAIAGYFGPEFDAWPTDKQERISRNRHGEMYDGDQSDLLDAARAVIEAMREPTEGMYVAGGIVNLDEMDEPWPENAVVCWQAMIDAALSPPSPQSD